MIDEIRNALEEKHGYSGEPETTDTAHSLQANLKVNKRDGDSGVLEESQEVKNIITFDGAQYVRDTVGNATATSAMRWTGVGNSSTNFGSSNAQLGSEIARSKNSFNTTGNSGQFSNVTTFTNIADTVKESGLFNDAGANSGTMLAAQSFGAITLTTSDSLEVIWKVYFSEA